MGAPSIKVRKAEILFYKIILMGCKWSDLNAILRTLYMEAPFVRPASFVNQRFRDRSKFRCGEKSTVDRVLSIDRSRGQVQVQVQVSTLHYRWNQFFIQ